MNFGGKIMKKTLLILLSLILCLSFTFTACNTDVEFGDDDANGTNEENKATEENQATEDTRPAPSGVDKSIAKNSLNKIDLSTLAGATETSFDIFADLVAGLDVTLQGTIDGEEGKILELRVAEGDMGKVIGRQGRIAKEIRTIIKTVAQRTGEKVTVEIVD